ncbi:MAG: response regulator, partial [Bryobacteraceae bacterium]
MTEYHDVLLIEDNPGDARLIKEYFLEAAPAEFRLHVADRLAKGLERLDAGGIDIVLLDLSLPDSRGFNTFAQIQNRAPDVPVILVTGQDDESLSLQAVRQGAQDFIVKGRADGAVLVRAVRYALERHRAHREQIGDAVRTPRRRPQAGKVIGFLGAKGGVGTTTVTLNVAAAYAAQSRQAIAAELRPDHGAFAWLTRQSNPHSLSGLLRADPVGESAVLDALYTVRPGLKLLYGPQNEDLFGEVRSELAQAIVRELSFQADFTLLDLPSAFSRDCLAAVRYSDFVAVVTEPEVVSLLAAERAIDIVAGLGISRSLIGLVVVERSPGLRVDADALQRDLGCSVVGHIPFAGDHCRRAAEVGTQIVALDPG